jgi:hypothetical protein
MHHVGTLTKSSRFLPREFHAQCSCGTAGEFITKGEAEAYLQRHFAKQGGIATFELVDATKKPEVQPPAAPVGGMGPTAKVASPPAPPAPPSAKT